MGADPLVYCLEHCTDYDQFERFCSDLMVSQGFKSLEPLGGMNDKGRDAIDIGTGPQKCSSIFAYSVREDWHKKLLDDCRKYI